MVDDVKWKIVDESELAGIVEAWSQSPWSWQFDAVAKWLSGREWTAKKQVRGMALFDTDLSVDTEAVLRLQNDEPDAVRSLTITVTTVLPVERSHNPPAKAFLAESFEATLRVLGASLGPPTSSGDQWDVPSGSIVAIATNRSIRVTFYSPVGLWQATEAARRTTDEAKRSKQKKAPAPWRV